MSAAQPEWSPVDDATADLLSLVAVGPMAPDTADREWDIYVRALRTEAMWGGGRINPNRLRKALRGEVKPQRVGAFTHRALSQGLVAYTGDWITSTDIEGRNGGKPCRELRWIGGAA